MVGAASGESLGAAGQIEPQGQAGLLEHWLYFTITDGLAQQAEKMHAELERAKNLGAVQTSWAS